VADVSQGTNTAIVNKLNKALILKVSVTSTGVLTMG
jgi:hypothetical protein